MSEENSVASKPVDYILPDGAKLIYFDETNKKDGVKRKVWMVWKVESQYNVVENTVITTDVLKYGAVIWYALRKNGEPEKDILTDEKLINSHIQTAIDRYTKKPIIVKYDAIYLVFSSKYYLRSLIHIYGVCSKSNKISNKTKTNHLSNHNDVKYRRQIYWLISLTGMIGASIGSLITYFMVKSNNS